MCPSRNGEGSSRVFPTQGSTQWDRECHLLSPWKLRIVSIGLDHGIQASAKPISCHGTQQSLKRALDKDSRIINMLVSIWAATRCCLATGYTPPPCRLISGTSTIRSSLKTWTPRVPLIHGCPMYGGLDTRSDLHGTAGWHIAYTMTNASDGLRQPAAIASFQGVATWPQAARVN